MKRRSLGILAASLALAAAAIPAQAHHSFASAFDANQPITVKGVIVEVRLENPHSWFFINVTKPDGKVEKWGFEAQTPTSLLRSGFKPNTVKQGDEVTIKGWRARDLNSNMGAARELDLPDGRAFAIGPTVAPQQ
jgi:hypothetical protein